MENETQKMFQEILKAIKGLDARIARLEAGSHTTSIAGTDVSIPPTVERKKSLKEFLLEIAPTDDVQKTLAIGYFLETHERITPLNKADLERGFHAAKEQLPTNINDKVNMSIKNGHMMEAETKKDSMKAWVITGTGENYIKNGFKKDTPRK